MNRKLPEWLGKKRLINSEFENSENEVILWEVLPIKKEQHIKVRFVSINSENRQGIRLAIDAGKGTLTTNGVTGRAFELWADECPEEFEVEWIPVQVWLSPFAVHLKLSQHC